MPLAPRAILMRSDTADMTTTFFLTRDNHCVLFKDMLHVCKYRGAQHELQQNNSIDHSARLSAELLAHLIAVLLDQHARRVGKEGPGFLT